MLNRSVPPRLGLLLALSALLVAPGAWAQKAYVALHPCVITGGKAKAPTSELEAVCALEVARTNVDLVPSSVVRDTLEKDARGSCARAKNRNGCLGRLASATRATRALYVTVDAFSRKTRITGLVVDTEGKLVEQKSLDLPRIPNQAPRDTVRIAVSQILSQLALTSAPLESTAETIPTLEAPPEGPPPPPQETRPNLQPPEPSPQPVVTAPPPAAEPAVGRSWKTPVGIAGVGAGVVGLGLGAFFLLDAEGQAKDFNEDYYGNGAPSLERKEQLLADVVRVRDDINSKRTLALVRGAAGVVLGGVGAYLWLSDGPSDQPRKAGSARLSAGPGNVGLLVILP
jgi:hypothetical protein